MASQLFPSLDRQDLYFSVETREESGGMYSCMFGMRNKIILESTLGLMKISRKASYVFKQIHGEMVIRKRSGLSSLQRKKVSKKENQESWKNLIDLLQSTYGENLFKHIMNRSEIKFFHKMNNSQKITGEDLIRVYRVFQEIVPYYTAVTKYTDTKTKILEKLSLYNSSQPEYVRRVLSKTDVRSRDHYDPYEDLSVEIFRAYSLL